MNTSLRSLILWRCCRDSTCFRWRPLCPAVVGSSCRGADREPRWERWVVVDLATGRPLEAEGERLGFCSYTEASFWLCERYGPLARYAVRDSRKL
jgi:hypothetical protein